jgi:SAM-dependent MidA family methyltransferase
MSKNTVTCNVSVEDLIIQKIRKEGPVSFRDFMEMALYYPGGGYYTSPGERIGTQGDYYTSPILTSLFGEMISRQLEEMWLLLGKEAFEVVEFGAGNGALCCDIITRLKQNKALYEKLRYCIIEKNEIQTEQKELPDVVKKQQNISSTGSINGCVLSNELLDNFPVHLVVMQDELMEVFVDYRNGFAELLQPASPQLKDYLHQQNIILPKGYRTEINLAATEWIKEIAATLKKGFVLTIDYGYTASELYHPGKYDGTLVCYHNHTINDQPLQNVGKQDITAHVNFSALQHWGSKYGLKCCGFTDQAHFLRALGLVNYLRMLEMKMNGNAYKLMAQVQTLLVSMGKKFKVLIQQKGMDRLQRLSGMQFSRQFV